jgi:hypothetical protein
VSWLQLFSFVAQSSPILRIGIVLVGLGVLASSCLSVGFTTDAVNVLASQGITVVDLMCDARSYLTSNYSSDFHPNDAGYAFIGSEIVSAITSASYPAPRSRCPPMLAVPWTGATPGRT